MKKVLSALLAFALLSSCNKSEETTSLNPNEAQLATLLASALKADFGEAVSPQIKKVSTSERGNLRFSYVDYRLNGKEYQNFAVVSGKGQFVAGGKVHNLSDGTVTVRCTGSCSNTSGQCRMTGYHDPNSGADVIECSCEGCTMEVH